MKNERVVCPHCGYIYSEAGEIVVCGVDEAYEVIDAVTKLKKELDKEEPHE